MTELDPAESCATADETRETDASQQPTIADVLDISYADPISDADGWSRVFHEPSQAPGPPRPEMFTGALGDLTRTIAPHVPWDPVAFHLQALVVIGNYLGFGPHIAEGATDRHANLFIALVGGTGSGKGSSLAWVRWMMAAIDEAYLDDRAVTAVGSGQGRLRKITDPVYGKANNGDQVTVVDGSDDKRVLYVEEELGQLFTKMMTQDTVEKMITKAWDSGVLETLTKHESMRCAQPHVSIIGHITPDELYDRLEKRLVDNGCSNRWLDALIKPTQIRHLEPQPHQVDGAVEIARTIGKSVRQITTDPDPQPFTLRRRPRHVHRHQRPHVRPSPHRRDGTPSRALALPNVQTRNDLRRHRRAAPYHRRTLRCRTQRLGLQRPISPGVLWRHDRQQQRRQVPRDVETDRIRQPHAD